MGILRKSTEETKRIMLDETDYIDVRADISKRDFNSLIGNMPNTKEGQDLPLSEATAFQQVLFETFVTGWSLTEGQPTVDDYQSLSAEAATAVDEAIADHFGSVMPTSAEGK